MNPGSMELNLFGQKIPLKVSETDPQLAREVLALVQLKIKEAQTRNSKAPSHQVLLVALLDLAEEYLKAQRRTVEYKKTLDERASQLITLIETELSG